MAILYQKLQFTDEDDRLAVHEFLARNELLFFWTFQKKEERRESGYSLIVHIYCPFHIHESCFKSSSHTQPNPNILEDTYNVLVGHYTKSVGFFFFF